MQRHRYVVAYDIHDPRRLTRVRKTLCGFGSPLQYSVFVCDLTLGELCDLRGQLRSIMHLSEDSAVFLLLGDGYDASRFEFLGARPPLPKRGAVIT